VERVLLDLPTLRRDETLQRMDEVADEIAQLA
jgi:hypothetical protein